MLIAIEPVLLALAAGLFIYITAAGLSPTIHEEPSLRVANYQPFILLFVGASPAVAQGMVKGRAVTPANTAAIMNKL